MVFRIVPWIKMDVLVIMGVRVVCLFIAKKRKCEEVGWKVHKKVFLLGSTEWNGYNGMDICCHLDSLEQANGMLKLVAEH